MVSSQADAPTPRAFKYAVTCRSASSIIAWSMVLLRRLPVKFIKSVGAQKLTIPPLDCTCSHSHSPDSCPGQLVSSRYSLCFQKSFVSRRARTGLHPIRKKKGVRRGWNLFRRFLAPSYHATSQTGICRCSGSKALRLTPLVLDGLGSCLEHNFEVEACLENHPLKVADRV